MCASNLFKPYKMFSELQILIQATHKVTTNRSLRYFVNNRYNIIITMS